MPRPAEEGVQRPKSGTDHVSLVESKTDDAARRQESPIDMAATDAQLLRQIADYYHSRLKENPKALEYLRQRGITNSEAIETFKIGFVDRTLGPRLPARQLKAGGAIRKRLLELGVLKASGHESMRGCVTFPVLLEGGGVGELYGRRIDDHPKRKTPLHWYLNGPHIGVWNETAMKATDEIILCKSILEALTFWSAGFRNVTASYGQDGFTGDIHSALMRNDIKRVQIAYDNTEEGDKAAAEIGKRLAADGLEIFRIRFPEGMDANRYARLRQPAGKSLSAVIRKAESMGEDEVPKEEEITVQAIGAEEEHTEDASVPIAPASPAATSQPPAQQEIEADVREREILIEIGNREYRVRGLEKNLAYDVLKVNILVRRDERFFVDTFDLYAARARGVFIKEASQELGFEPDVIKRDLGKVLLKLETLQDQQIEATLSEQKDRTPKLSDNENQAALDLLKQPNLIDRIVSDFEACGVVGEETNKLVGYLAATSRMLDKPLAVVIQSSSAAGKSSLMDAILRFIPVEQQVGYSAMTGQSLFYMGGMELSHRILAIAEEEGVTQASYALKLLQSEGELTIASTGKDPGTGRMETQEYHVEGPVMIFLTTTAIDVDEELLNRCIVLTVDENREQTRAIHDQQRRNETLEGLLASGGSSSIRKLHQNAQRLLRPLAVVNPYAHLLEFCDDQARRRRDHMKYLTLIRSIALLHQYQREIKSTTIGEATVEYIEVAPADIAVANRLADQVLGKSIDELPPQTRRLLAQLHEWVCGECKRTQVEQREYRFTRRMVREALGWNQTSLKKHLDRLIEMEYVLSHPSGSRRQEYEMLYDGRGREGQPTMCGLIDVAKLTGTTIPSSPLQPSSSPQDHPVITP